MGLQQNFPVNAPAELHLDKAADAPEFHHKAFHPKSDERSEVKGGRLPAPVQHAVILDVVQVEII
jgi:hypothetical protein